MSGVTPSNNAFAYPGNSDRFFALLVTHPARMPARRGSFTIRIANWEKDREALRLVREAVFIQEQEIPAALEWDEHDSSCLHLLALDPANSPVGTVRLLPDGSIGRMAVLKAWRKKGLGGLLLQQALNEARNRGFNPVTLNAQTHALYFYRKFGFNVTGPEFLDAGLPHVPMSLHW